MLERKKDIKNPSLSAGHHELTYQPRPTSWPYSSTGRTLYHHRRGQASNPVQGPVSRKSRKAIGKTPPGLFCEAGLFISCNGNIN